MVLRTKYLEQLQLFKDKQIIKVITGIRRCGKSTLLRQFIDALTNSGVKAEQIIHINFEDLKFENLLDYRALYDYVSSKLCKDKFTYIFLDEIQQVDNFQKVVDSLYIQDNVDVYVTGSNSDLLSSELATLLTGRYVEIKLLPLSFAEYMSAQNAVSPYDAFYDYAQSGGMPYALSMTNKQAKDIYLQGIYNTILVNDISKRHSNTDMRVLESIIKYLLHNVGSLVSSTNIANALTSNGRKVSYNTVEKYIGYLTECFFLYEVTRYDVKGKQHLKSLAKYYVVDIGLRNTLLTNTATDIGHILENIVYLELLRRYNGVFVGKWENKEVDFVATTDDGINYYQVSASISNNDTLNRELASFQAIKDNYPKIVLTLDRIGLGDYNGIKILNVVDWLLN